MSQAIRQRELTGIQIENNTGQIAIGRDLKQTQYILQLIPKNGDKVDNYQLDIRPKHSPPLIRPRRFPGLLDRQAELETATKYLESQEAVELYGVSGIGKSVLLRKLTHYPWVDKFPDGTIALSPLDCGDRVEDILHRLFSLYYETNLPIQLFSLDPRLRLQNKHPLLILDDNNQLSRKDLEELMNAVPEATFLVASRERRLFGEGQSVHLRGLPLADAIQLMERELEHDITQAEHSGAENLWRIFQGHPASLIHVAALSRDRRISLSEISRQLDQDTTKDKLAILTWLISSEQERDIMKWLAIVNGAYLSADHLSDLTSLPETKIVEVMATLLTRGLVKSDAYRYSLIQDIVQAIKQRYDLTWQTEKTIHHFISWARQNRRNPDRILDDIVPILRVFRGIVEAEQWPEVLQLGQAIEGALALGGYRAARTEVLEYCIRAAEEEKDREATAWARHQFGTWALCFGDRKTALYSLFFALRVRTELGDSVSAAITQHNIDVLLTSPPSNDTSEPPSSEPPADSPPNLIPPSRMILSSASYKAILAILAIPLVVLTALVAQPVVSLILFDTPTPTPTPQRGIVYEQHTPTSTFTPSPTKLLPAPTTSTPTWSYTPVPATATPTSTRDVEGPRAPMWGDPDGVSVSCNVPLTELIAWEAVSDPSGIVYYTLELWSRPLNGGRDWELYEIWWPIDTEQVMSLPCNDTAYRWRVQAVDKVGNLGYWSSWFYFENITLPLTDTPTPTYTPVTPTPTSTGTPTFTLTPTSTSTGTPTFTLTPTPTSTGTPTSTPTPTPIILFDFLAEPGAAEWYSGQGNLPFPGSDTDERGFVLWRYDALLEDGSRAPRVLETHPEWIDDGWIVGAHNNPALIFQPGDRFVGRVGFLQGAQEGGVTFRISLGYPGGEEFCCTVIEDLVDSYDGQVKMWNFPIPEAAFGHTITRVSMVVAAGSTSAQDWAIWEVARFERP